MDAARKKVAGDATYGALAQRIAGLAEARALDVKAATKDLMALALFPGPDGESPRLPGSAS